MEGGKGGERARLLNHAGFWKRSSRNVAREGVGFCKQHGNIRSGFEYENEAERRKGEGEGEEVRR